jgi:hypothetical protein
MPSSLRDASALRNPVRRSCSVRSSAMGFPLSSHANKAGVKWAHFTYPARMLPLLCREKWKTAGKRCTRVCNQRGKWCTERYEPCSALQTLRFLGHSLTSFGHDAAASVTSSGRKPCKRSVGLPVFHRLRPPDEHHRNLAISGAQIRRGETRQDLKIPTVSDGSLPRALSCSHPEVYPLQTAVRWRFLIPTRATGFL